MGSLGCCGSVQHGFGRGIVMAIGDAGKAGRTQVHTFLHGTNTLLFTLKITGCLHKGDKRICREVL